MLSLTFAIIIVIFFFSSRVIAVPTDHVMHLLSDKREVAISGATSYQVIAWVVAEAIFFLFVLGCYGLRAKTLKLFRLASLNFSRCLLHIIYVSSLAFLVSVLVSGLGWGMHKGETCLAAIEVCLVFYLGGKVILYIFLMERVHALRKGYYPRSKDRLWQTCFFLVISCFGEIAVICFFYPVASVEAGYCTIGLRTYITLPMLIFDIACNLTVSWIFYRFAKDQFPTFFHAFIDPDVAWFFGRIGTMFRCSGGVIGIDLRHQPAKASETIVAFITRKTLFSSVAILVSTAVNLGLLFHYNGAEHGWLCWLMCSMDIVWNTGWVTFVTALPTHDETINTANYIDRREEFNFENTGSNNPQPRSVIELEEYPPRSGTARTTAASENSSTRPLRPTFRP